MRKRISLLFLMLSSAVVFAQRPNDSLWKIWNDTSKPDTLRLLAMDDLAWNTRNKNPDSSISLAMLELELAKAKGEKIWEGNAYNMLGVAYYIKSDYAKSVEWHKKSFSIWQELGDTRGMASSYNNLGNVFSDQGDYASSLLNYKNGLALEETDPKPLVGTYHVNIGEIYLVKNRYPEALEEFQKALAAYEKTNDKQGTGLAFVNIGAIYDDMNNLPLALEYFQRALSVNQKLEDKKGIAEAYTNIGLIHKKLGHFDQALSFQRKSLALQKEVDNKQAIAANYLTLGGIYMAQHKLEDALTSLQTGMKMSEQLGIKVQVASANIQIATAYQEQKKYLPARDWFLKGLKLSGELGLVVFQRDASKGLYEINKILGNKNEALDYHEKFLMFSDSLQVTETNKKLDEMEFAKLILADSLKTETKRAQVAVVHEKELDQKNQQRNIALYTGVGVLLIAGGLWSRLRYVRKSRTAIQKEKNRSENLLLNILPAEIAEELKANGKAEARDFDLVSILFTDFKGFTSMSEKMSAKELVSEINFCFEAFDRIAGNYQIEKIKTIGDSYMAAGGLPLPSESSVKNTVLAAIAMQDFVKVHQQKREAEGLAAFQMRVGVHTGPVVAGIVGVKKFQYDIWGDTVNTASRMESSGQVGEVNISATTYELIRNDPQFHFQSRGMVEAKGKGEISMYFVHLKAAVAGFSK